MPLFGGDRARHDGQGRRLALQNSGDPIAPASGWVPVRSLVQMRRGLVNRELRVLPSFVLFKEGRGFSKLAWEHTPA